MTTGSSGGGGGGGRRGGDDVGHGLQFGKKIYFEQDAAAGASGSVAAATGGRKGKGRSGGGGAGAPAAPAPPPRCQVEGCVVDLSGARTYHFRHKVCEAHTKEGRVVVAGLEQRFCQQCSRFHQLPAFDQEKRSCRRRLEGHNERRRKPQPGHLSPRYGRLAASFHEEASRSRSFLMDFASYPRVQSRARDVWPSVLTGSSGVQWQGGQELHPHRGSAVAGYGEHHAYGGGSPAMLQAFDLAGLTAADASCALSPLSTQPWDTATATAAHSRSPAMSSTTSTFGGNPVVPSVMANTYMAAAAAASSPWTSSRGHDGHHHLPHAAALHSLHHGHFSGELELALQSGAPPNPPPPQQHSEHAPGAAFSHLGNAMYWSL